MSKPVPKRSSPALTTLFVVVVLAILYPLSAGPAIWLLLHMDDTDWAFAVAEVVYSPINWAYQNTDFGTNPIGRAYDHYLDLWTR